MCLSATRTQISLSPDCVTHKAAETGGDADPAPPGVFNAARRTA